MLGQISSQDNSNFNNIILNSSHCNNNNNNNSYIINKNNLKENSDLDNTTGCIDINLDSDKKAPLTNDDLDHISDIRMNGTDLIERRELFVGASCLLIVRPIYVV